MKTFKFLLVLRTHENTDVFITLDENIYGIHNKTVNTLYVILHLNICYGHSLDMPLQDSSVEYLQHNFFFFWKYEKNIVVVLFFSFFVKKLAHLEL